jgi:hypothetical protein
MIYGKVMKVKVKGYYIYKAILIKMIPRVALSPPST